MTPCPAKGVKPLQIGGVTLSNNIFLAPLAGYTDIAFRRLCRDFGAGLTTTEMVSVKGLYYNSANTRELLAAADNETPSCVQLFGSDKEFFVRAINSPELEKFDIIDINMGCPMPKITKNGDGSALMKDVRKAAGIVEACAKTGRTVTVKMRTGWDKINAVEFARALQDAGAELVAVHGRTTQMLYGGNADWDIIASVAAALEIPVIGNGNIKTVGEVEFALENYGVAGVMIGRGALGQPDLFARLTGRDGGRLVDIILKHIDYMRAYFPERYVVTNMRKHLACYLKGVPDTKQLRQEVNVVENLNELVDKIKTTFGVKENL